MFRQRERDDLIRREDVLSQVLLVSPRFKEEAEENREEFESPCALLMALAGHVFEDYKNKQLDEIRAVFDLVERLHKQGDHEVQEAATICFLESLQTISGNGEVDPEVFLPFLGEETRRWWDAVNDFWSGKKNSVRLN